MNLERPADIQAGLGVLGMHLEVIAVGKIAWGGLQGGRIGDHCAIGIQQQHFTFERRSGGQVKLHQVLDICGNLGQVLTLPGSNQPFEGQVVEFDVTQHVGIDQLRNIGG